MNPSTPEEVQEAIKAFSCSGVFISSASLKVGHINETYVSLWEDPATKVISRYVHQVINTYVFKQPEALMANLEKALLHIASKNRGGAGRVVRIVQARAGGSFWKSPSGKYWRTYDFVEGTKIYESCPSAAVACEAARVLARFIRDLADLSPGEFSYALPDYHNTPTKFVTLEQAVATDSLRRVSEVSAELDFIWERQGLGSAIMEPLNSGDIPLRLTHNDPKLNNVLFDEKSGDGVCIVDLDTIQPGSSLFDFGDFVRSVGVTGREDTIDLASLSFEMSYFEGAVQGFVGELRGLLNKSEIELLAFAPRVIALELGIRFFTDYLQGDKYFRIHRPAHNLERARCQFQIVRLLEEKESEMRRVVASAK